MAQQLSGNDLQGWDGWIALPLTPVFGSSTTFTYPADLTGILDAGDKIKVTNNGSVKYFYVLPPVLFSAGSSTVTITGGSDYSLVNSGSPVMASLYYSKMATPHGFPQWFNYTPTLVGWTTAPVSAVYRFNVTGRQVTVLVSQAAATGVTSNSTSLTITPPIAPISTTTQYFGATPWNLVDNGTVQTTAGRAFINGGATVISCNKDMPGTAWTASGNKAVSFTLTYEF